MLLGAVVQVALDLSAGLVGGGHHAGPGGDQLLVAAPQLFEAGLERGVEAHVVQGETDLAGQVDEDPVLLLGERRPVAAALDDDEAEQLAEVGDRDRPDDAVLPSGEKGRRPHLEPGVALGVGPGHDRQLLGGEPEVPGLAVGHRHRAGHLAVGAGPDLGCVELHGLLQGLDQLEEELVEGDGAGHAPPEGAQRLLGRVALAVDALIGPLLEAARVGKASTHATAAAAMERARMVRSSPSGSLTQADDHEHVHAADQAHQPRDHEGVDERRLGQERDARRRGREPRRRGRRRIRPPDRCAGPAGQSTSRFSARPTSPAVAVTRTPHTSHSRRARARPVDRAVPQRDHGQGRHRQR